MTDDDKPAEKPKEHSQETAGSRLPENWRQQFIEILNKKIPGVGVCPRCGGTNQSVPEHAVTPTQWTGSGAVVIGGPTYPQGMIVCMSCGYTSYFNLIVLGIIKAPPKNEPKSGEGANG